MCPAWRHGLWRSDSASPGPGVRPAQCESVSPTEDSGAALGAVRGGAGGAGAPGSELETAAAVWLRMRGCHSRFLSPVSHHGRLILISQWSVEYQSHPHFTRVKNRPECAVQKSWERPLLSAGDVLCQDGERAGQALELEKRAARWGERFATRAGSTGEWCCVCPWQSVVNSSFLAEEAQPG